MEYGLVIKRNQVLIHATRWKTPMLENMILSEKSPGAVVHIFSDSICLKSAIGKSIKIESFSRWFPSSGEGAGRGSKLGGRIKWGGVGKNGEWRKIANSHRFFSLRLYKFSKMDCGDECTTLNIVKNILYKEKILCYVKTFAIRLWYFLKVHCLKKSWWLSHTQKKRECFPVSS